MPHFIRCAAAYATLGEQCAVLRGVFGEYREPVLV
jgi:methylmalonyl-CoA mutase N-terminal domain/subunit